MSLGLRFKLIKRWMPSPVQARHALYSMLYSQDDNPGQPNLYLIDISIEAIKQAQKISLNDISARLKSSPFYPDIWPGEHYKILAGLTLTLRPKLVIEVGTAEGLSALSIKKYLAPHARIVTFDLVDWRSYPGAVLKENDLKDGRLIQLIDDLANPQIINKHKNLLKQAEMIFFDAGKDGVMEQKFIDNFKTINFHKKPLVIFDDVRVWPMLKIWRGLAMPKLDLVSFGHWTGTGLVDWNV